MGAEPEGWEELFPESEHEFRLTLRRGVPHEFFRRGPRSAAVREERRRWLQDERARYLGFTPEAVAVVEELAAEAAGWPEPAQLRPGSVRNTADLLTAIGEQWEADVVVLTRAGDGSWVLRGGVLCFPTGWALADKIGQPLEAIHGVVPGLNPAIGASIHHFLSKLRPGIGYLRHNWGLAASDELNLHPARGIPPPRLPIRLDALWLRVERQILFSLPRSGGVVFGIKIDLYRMDELLGLPVALRLRRALASLPDELAGYKRIESIRAELIKMIC
jgi:hypothetical protein